MRFTLEVADAAYVFAGHQREQAFSERTANDDQRPAFGACQHGLLERIVGHGGLAADHHGDARGMHGECYVHVKTVLLEIAAFFCYVERPAGTGASGVVDGDFLKVRGLSVDVGSGQKGSEDGEQESRKLHLRFSHTISSL